MGYFIKGTPGDPGEKGIYGERDNEFIIRKKIQKISFVRLSFRKKALTYSTGCSAVERRPETNESELSEKY